MYTFITSRLGFDTVQSHLQHNNYFSDKTWKYGKIASVALAILGACVAIFYIYRSYQARQLSPDETVVSPRISPKQPAHQTQKTPIQLPYNLPKNADNSEQKVDPKRDNVVSPSQQEQDDFELAKQLQEEELLEENDDNDNQTLPDTKFDSELKQSLSDLFKQMSIVNGENAKPQNTQTPSSPKLTSPATSPNLSASENSKPVTVVEASKTSKSTQSSFFVQIDQICAEIAEKTFTTPSFSAVKALSAVQKKEVLDILNEIMSEFENRYPISRKLKFKEPVPVYFANVAEQSDYDRKYLSLAGIRNLLHVGPNIIDDFRDTKYLGGEHHYQYNRGLRTFKYFTGNVVDLDTEIEAKSDAEALKIAEGLIVKFGEACGLKKPGYGSLTAADVAAMLPNRNLSIKGPIHFANDNQDRSNYGIWKRSSPITYETFYYVNVPNRDITLLATLRLPYLIAEIAYRTKEKNNGKLPKEFFDEFFAQGISTKCFNDKARTFMEFCIAWNAKLDDAPSAEDDARRNIENGTFGEALRKKGVTLALKEALTRDKLIGILDAGLTLDCKGRTFDKFLADEEENIRKLLISKNLWEETLYQTEKGTDKNSNDLDKKPSEYFLLNQKTLNLFLKDYHTYLESFEKLYA